MLKHLHPPSLKRLAGALATGLLLSLPMSAALAETPVTSSSAAKTTMP